MLQHMLLMLLYSNGNSGFTCKYHTRVEVALVTNSLTYNAVLIVTTLLGFTAHALGLLFVLFFILLILSS